MKKHPIELSLVAYTDAAGKSTPGAPRDGNEDNFYVNYSIGAPNSAEASADVFPLGRYGILMAIADGMGGMNAGEVASKIAIDTVKEAIENIDLTHNQLIDVNFRRKYLERIIRDADTNIKGAARTNPAQENMGSTIILAWLFDNELTLSWCGDSRLYIFNPRTGIRLISRDHSFVQDLVAKGMLTYDQTFDHPQNNIVTRSLGDPAKEARPESKSIQIGKGDIILMCSDGLSGVLRDRKTYNAQGQLYPGQNIEDIIRESSSLKDCRENLWKAAEAEGWYDNVTAILCEIVDGPASPDLSGAPVKNSAWEQSKWKYLCFVLGLIVIGFLVYTFIPHTAAVEEIPVDTDSIEIPEPDTVKIDVEAPPASNELPGVERKNEDKPIPETREARKDPNLTPPETLQEYSGAEEKSDELTKIQPKVDNLTPIKKKEIKPEIPTPNPEQYNDQPDISPLNQHDNI